MDKVGLLQAPQRERWHHRASEEPLSGAPAGYLFYQAVHSADNWIYELPILATRKMVAFPAQLLQSLAQESTLSQLAMESFSLFSAVSRVRTPARVSRID